MCEEPKFFRQVRARPELVRPGVRRVIDPRRVAKRDLAPILPVPLWPPSARTACGARSRQRGDAS